MVTFSVLVGKLKKDSIDNVNDFNISSCVICSMKLKEKTATERALCFKCMAYIVENLDINPHEDYPLFIEYAYEVKRRLSSGDEIRNIFRNKPKGFEQWLTENHMKKGYGIILNGNR